jgi:chloramphenicol-sensitive protein RarD
MALRFRRGIALAVSAYLLWGLLTIYWKALGDFSAVELIGWRLVTAIAVMLVVLAVSGRLAALRYVAVDSALRRRVALAGVLLVANWTGYVYAVVTDHIIETALGYFMAPLGTMLIGVMVLGERLRASQTVAMVLAGAAIVVMTVSYGRIPWVALVLAGTWCVYGLLKKQVPLHPFESLTAEISLMSVPAVAIVAWGATQSTSVVRTASPTTWLLVLGSGVITVVPLVLFAGAAKHVPLTVMGPLQYMVPTINLGLGWLVYHEELPLSRFMGFVLVWSGLVLVAADSLRRRRAEHRVTAPAASGSTP